VVVVLAIAFAGLYFLYRVKDETMIRSLVARAHDLFVK